MIMDELAEFHNGALNTGAAGTYLLGDVYDTGGDGINDVDELYFVLLMKTSATSAGASTGQFSFVSDAQAAIATNGTATVHWQSPVIPLADLTAGTYVARVELPKEQYERYLGVLQATGTAAFTGGVVNAFLTKRPPTGKAFPQAAAASLS